MFDGIRIRLLLMYKISSYRAIISTVQLESGKIRCDYKNLVLGNTSNYFKTQKLTKNVCFLVQYFMVIYAALHYFAEKQQENVDEKRKNILNAWKTEYLYQKIRIKH